MLTLKIVPVTRGEVFTKRFAVKEAARARDAATKSLYEAIFLWVVKAINLSLAGANVVGEEKLPFIGLLDIFGGSPVCRYRVPLPCAVPVCCYHVLLPRVVPCTVPGYACCGSDRAP